MELSFSKKNLQLNKEQADAITRPLNIHQRIIASAGSGKTTTLTGRIAYLIEHYNIPSKKIVLLTFSRNSSQQMKQKIFELIGENNIWAGTFHGLAKSLLKQYDNQELNTLYFVDELVSMGAKWLHTEKGREWVKNISYIFIDEFQDINQSQWVMIQNMLHPGARLVVVGDDCQNIYTWRGSNVSFILNLEKELNNLVDDQLHINYRSSKSIISVANAVMKNIPTLPWKHTMLSNNEKSKKPECRFFHRTQDEINWIFNDIQRHTNKSIAIISRINQDLYKFEEEALQRSIPYYLSDLETVEKPTDTLLQLATIHTSKGLEWDIVYLVHCNDDVFPSSKKENDIINERRLFYVATTRAREELYFSYTNDERTITRYIREIPNILIKYHGLANYILSDYELGKNKKRLIDIIGCLTTEDIDTLRKQKKMDWFVISSLTHKHIYPSDVSWTKPNWVGSDFERFLQIWLQRELCQKSKISFTNSIAKRMIFTLRIYAEDFDFWSQWKSEIRSLVDALYETDLQKLSPPNIDYADLQLWSKRKSVPWNSQDLIKATNILAKIRGQLRPLRFYNYDIKEFTIGPSRYVVPIQWRGEVLESWRRVVSDIHWFNCLEDIWRIGALLMVAEGRNVGMYRTSKLKEHFSKLSDFLYCLSDSITFTIIESSITIENSDNIQEVIDFRTKDTLFFIGSSTFNPMDLLRLAIASTFFKEEINKVSIFFPIEGKISTLELPKNREVLLSILELAIKRTI